MPEPVPAKVYRQYSFTNFQTTQPATPLPGQSVDNELDRTDNTVNDVIDFMRQAIGDDGKIKPGAATSLIGPEGPQGPTGATGPQGIQGQRGPQGVPGNDGPEGPQGQTGEQGEMFTPDKVGPIALRDQYDAEPVGFSYLAEDTSLLYFREGPPGNWTGGASFGQGPRGPQGIPGPEGPQGDIGPQGPKGDKGDTGNQGPAGADGADGQNPDAATVAAPVKNPPVDADLFGFVDTAAGNTWAKFTWANLKAALAAVFDLAYLKLTGGTLTGDLIINKAGASISLWKTASGQSAIIASRTANVLRWAMHLGNTGAESTGNAGSNFALEAFSDAGASLGNSLFISRADHAATFAGKANFVGGTISGEVKATLVNNQYRLTATGVTRAAFQRIDAGNWYLMITADGQPDGTWETPFPFQVALATKDVIIAGALTVGANALVSGNVVATAAQYLANTPNKMMVTDKVWGAAQSVVVAYAASVTINLATGINFQITSITGSLSLPNPTNVKAGQSGFIRLNLAAGGAGAAIFFGANFYFPTGTKPTNMGSNLDMLYYQAIDTATLCCSYVKSYTNA